MLQFHPYTINRCTTVDCEMAFSEEKDRSMVTQTRYASAERCGARVRALREEREWSTTLLAKKAGFSQQQICQVELGKINTPIETLARIADALGVELGELIFAESQADECPLWMVTLREKVSTTPTEYRASLADMLETLALGLRTAATAL